MIRSDVAIYKGRKMTCIVVRNIVLHEIDINNYDEFAR